MERSETCDRTRLSPFEEYMLGDEWAGWPMTVWIRLRFNRALNSTRLSRAMAATAAEHPLLSARLVRDGRGRPYWVRSAPQSSVRTFESADGGSHFPASPPFDLEREPPWRIWKNSCGDDPIIWLEMHHAASDGIGAFRAVDDLLTHYGEDAPQPAAPGANWGQLAHRHRCDNLSRMRDRLGQWTWMLWRITAYAITAPACLEVLSRPEGIPAKDRDTSEACSLNLGPVEKFRRAAQQAGCTLNDLVLHHLFDALQDLFARRQPNQRHRLRLIVPMDLRGNPRNECQVGNIVGMLHIDRVVGPGTEPLSLDSISRDMKVYRRYQMGRALVVSLEAATGLLGSPRWLLSPRFCAATSVLTNLKAPLAGSQLAAADGRLHFGTKILESVDLFPPVRPRTPACFGLLTYGGQLRLNLRFQPALFPREDAAFLLDHVMERMHPPVPADAHGATMLAPAEMVQ